MFIKVNAKKSQYERWLETENNTLHERIVALERQLKLSHEELLTDPLTKVGNRRRFDESIENEMMHLARSKNKEHLSIVLVDLDNFKQINDTMGHSSGDKILIGAGNVLKSAFSRNIDVVCRYGGDEFAIVLPNTEMGGAIIASDMARRLAEQAGIQMSLGISSISSANLSKKNATTQQIIKDLVEDADANMYLDKSSRKSVVLRR